MTVDGEWVAGRWSSPSGAELQFHHMDAGASARGVVHIQHGLAEHSGRYGPLAGVFRDHGFHVYAHDHRGHGGARSQPDGPRLFAEARGWDAVIQDAIAFRQEVMRRHAPAPLVSLGHSMGSVIALEAALRAPEDLAGLILLSPPLHRDPAMPLARLLLWLEGAVVGRRTTSRLFAHLGFRGFNTPFEPARTAFDWLSADPQVVDAYIADDDCGWDATNDMAAQLCKGIAATYDDRRLALLRRDLPVLLMAGELDPVSKCGQAIRELAARLRAVGMTDVSEQTIAGARHELHHDRRDGAPATLMAEWAGRIAGA